MNIKIANKYASKDCETCGGFGVVVIDEEGNLGYCHCIKENKLQEESDHNN